MPARALANGLDDARALDAADALKSFRRRFELPAERGRTLTYLCGHSLGLMPRRARADVERELARWAKLGVEGHFGDDGWLHYHARFSAPLAELAGAESDEVVAMNTLTVNLHLMLVSFFRPTRERRKILIERDAFPSDRYVVQSQLRFHGLDPAEDLLEIAPRAGTAQLELDDFRALLEAHGERIALVLLPGVQYLSGERLDIAQWTAEARRFGCTVGFDLAHAIGNVPLALHEAGPDFAVWCSYKYLNAGPGAVGGCFVHRRWAEATVPRFAGWWGHDVASRFAMPREFAPIPGAQAWQLSNPPILSLAPLAASLELFGEAGMTALRRKSERLTAYLERQLVERLGERVAILTPSNPARRGCELSVQIRPTPRDPNALLSGLRRAGVIADVRAPNVLRLALVPLYNRFADALAAVRALAVVLSE
jgi:kynureninase